jgi:uncharacterized flavoprotein (TIGR03862 family)
MKSKKIIAVVGAGPAGLMAAQTISQNNRFEVHVFDAMASVGRKFLLAGLGGLNITHSENKEIFLKRYQSTTSREETPIRSSLDQFDAQAVIDWVHSLGITTFVGSSGRVFPEQMKAAPLLRSWLLNLRKQGVMFHSRHRLTELSQSQRGIHLDFHHASNHEPVAFEADACVLALGGASWSKLGSDGAWVALLESKGVAVTPLEPSNCGFESKLSEFLVPKYSGAAVKNCAMQLLKSNDLSATSASQKGEFVITGKGFEGQLIYALSAGIRDEIKALGEATIELDLRPDKTEEELLERLNSPRGSRSLTKHLQTTLNLSGVHLALLYEYAHKSDMASNQQLAYAIKHIRIILSKPTPIDEAISTAGGIALNQIDNNFMLKQQPNIFVAGEMLDWEAPTGGYLLSACFATGKSAGNGVNAVLNEFS